MAIYHLRASVISRSSGRSATAAAAYRSASKIDDERTGLSFDYEGKGGVEDDDILAPDHAPDWVHDRSTLWNRVEAAETRKNSQVAREIRVALPFELNPEQRFGLVRDFCQREFVERGMVADIALHVPGRAGDDRNHHAHIMLTTREIDAQGFAKKNRDWNKVEVLEHWREAWAVDCNDALERAGLEERVDHRTLEAQRDEARELSDSAQERGDDIEALAQTVRAVELDRKPLPQLSPGAWQMKERGHDIPAVSLWREVKAQAVEVKRVAAELAGQVRSWLERTAERAVDRIWRSEPALTEVGPVAARRINEPPKEFAARLREAWAAQVTGERERSGVRAGSHGDDTDPPRRDEEEVLGDRPRGLTAELRQAAQGIDQAAALEKALAFQQTRKDEERRREITQRQKIEREKAAEERKRQEAEVKRNREWGRGISR